MAVCVVCDKKRTVAQKVSHSNIKTKVWKFPNLQRVKVMTTVGPRYLNVCTRCIRSGFIVKAP
jgi:large subunit ribosomal protein L28